MLAYSQSWPIRRIIRNTPYNTGFGATVSYLYAVLYGVLYLNPKIRRIIRESKAPYRIFRIVLANSALTTTSDLAPLPDPIPPDGVDRLVIFQAGGSTRLDE